MPETEKSREQKKGMDFQDEITLKEQELAFIISDIAKRPPGNHFWNDFEVRNCGA